MFCSIIPLLIKSTDSEINLYIIDLGPSVDYLVRLNTAAVIGLVVGVLVVMVLVYTCGLLTGSLVQRQRGGAGKCPPTSAPTSPVAPDTAAVQLPPVYEQVLPPATTSTSIPLEENISYATKQF